MDAPTLPVARSPAGELTAEEFHRARNKALVFAKVRTHCRSKAEELVDDAIAASFDPEGSPWDRKTEPDFARHLVRTLFNKLPAILRGEQRRNDPGWQATAATKLMPRPENPEQKLDEAQQQSLASEALDDAVAALRAARHHQPARVLELWRDEIDETLDVIERSSEEDEAERILALSDEELERELAGAGFDPRAVRARGEALAEKLGVNTSFLEAPAKDAPAGEPSTEPAAWVTQAAPRRHGAPAARWAMLLAAALAAAATGAGVLYGLAHRPKPNDKPVDLPREVPTLTPPPPQDTGNAPRTEPQKPYRDLKSIPPRDIKSPR